MATMNNLLFVKSKSFLSAVSDVDKNGQYSNLNLNKTSTFSTASDFQSDCKNQNNKHFGLQQQHSKLQDFTTSNNFEEKEKLREWQKNGIFDSKVSNFDENEVEKRWKKNDSSNAKNDSTLSLHISAYENLNEASSEYFFKKSFQKSWLIQKQKQINSASTFASQNPFEFQRQQSDKVPEPEVSQFKASQRLINTLFACCSRFSNSRPTSKQHGRRLTEFSLSAVIEPNGKFSNQSLQLQWNETKKFQLPSTTKLFAAGDGKLYDDLAITNHPSAETRTTKSNSIPSMEFIGSNTVSFAAPTSDVFATSYASTNKSKSFCNNNSRQCPNSSASTPIVQQLVLYVTVDLRIVFFQWPGLIVRKQVVKEVRNDLTTLEVLQHLIKCSGVELNTGMNCDTARLFCLRETQKGLRFEEIDYLQWRCALLAEMSTSVSFQFLLDFTDTEDGINSFATSSAHSICPIDMEFKQ